MPATTATASSVVQNLARPQVEPAAETIRDQVARLPGVIAVGRAGPHAGQ